MMNENEENTSIVDSTFVRKEFYVEPPARDASVDEWNAWDREDKKRARAAKAQHTRLMNLINEDEPLDLDSAPCSVRKINGVYRSSPTVSLVGDFEEGSGSVEPAVEQESTKLAIMNRWAEDAHKRGSKSKAKALRRKANRKARELKRNLADLDNNEEE